MNDLTLDTRVLTVTFSEFGRRVSQNASGGTDHGTAAPMFICGPMIRPGVIGDHPRWRTWIRATSSTRSTSAACTPEC